MRVMFLVAAAAVFTLGACAAGDDSAAVDTAVATTSAAADANPSLPPPITSPADDPDQNTINAALKGLTIEQAEAAASAAGYSTRVVSVDDEPRMMTMDYRTDRINLEIVDDRVDRAYVG